MGWNSGILSDYDISFLFRLHCHPTLSVFFLPLFRGKPVLANLGRHMEADININVRMACTHHLHAVRLRYLIYIYRLIWTSTGSLQLKKSAT
jgi:hypothetical protein